MLSFIGIGSAFNTELGNNCAYIKKGHSIVMIDCGSTTFSTMRELDILKDVRDVFVIITHLHPDHIASLGDLIFFCTYGLNTKANIATPDEENVKALLRLMGVEDHHYNMIDLNTPSEIVTKDISLEIETIRVEHVKALNCFGYILSYEGKKIYYSGDSKSIGEDVLSRFKEGEIALIYQDTSKIEAEANPHMSIKALSRVIDMEQRHRVFCMHLNENFDTSLLKDLGFQVVEKNHSLSKT